MSYISVENLTSIHLELSDYCNAACPMCPRFDWNGNLQTEYTNSHNISLDLIKKRLEPKLLKQLRQFWSNGTYGDGAVNPECLDIFQYVRSINADCQLMLLSNGGARNEKFWHDLGCIPGMQVRFAIDGLEDTNHLYRRNVGWKQLMKNVRSFIAAGGNATWVMLIFKHNEHQVEQARQMSQNLGFKIFHPLFSERWKQRNWVHLDEVHDLDRWPVDDYYLEKPLSQPTSGAIDPNNVVFNFHQPINCKVFNNKVVEIYIRADGTVQPCCMVGETKIHEVGNLVDDRRNINLHHTSLNDILTGSFFSKIADGIAGGSTRLHNCFYICGHDEGYNQSQSKYKKQTINELH
jgi:MoaA/NifB/PqqE/SkfB family radical SAM enzyme